MNTKADTASEMISVWHCLWTVFFEAEELNASFERSPKTSRRREVDDICASIALLHIRRTVL